MDPSAPTAPPATDGQPPGHTVIVRLTARCQNTCRHCCYECGPQRTEVMPLATAQQVRTCFAGQVTWLNVMGGELTLLPNYPELLDALHFVPLRVVTNGWWVDDERARAKLLDTVRTLSHAGPPVYLGISRDRYHPPGVGDRAHAWLTEQIQYQDDWGFTATKDPLEEEKAIAPVGRAWQNDLGDDLLRMFGAYCRAHEHRQSMTVLEDGSVTYCPFGAWPLGYLHWGFDNLEENRARMAKVWIDSCNRCWQTWIWDGGKTRSLANLHAENAKRPTTTEAHP